MQYLSNLWADAHGAILEYLVQPLMFRIGLTTYYEDVGAAVELVMLGATQILVILCVFRPIERGWSGERWSDPRPVRVDVTYTLLNQLGLLPLLVFVVMLPLVDELLDMTRLHGFVLPTVEQLVPWLGRNPLALFLVYFAAYDFAGYWMHRLQHALPWWWALHSLHHSQRQVGVWTDNRNHVFDDILREIWLAVVAILIGVEPGQYVGLILATRLIESFSHANVRFGFGRVFDKIVVDPWFHRTHHALASPAEPHIHDRNFSAVLPIWDILFRTAVYDYKPRPTGVDDPGVDADNALGWWGQQVAVGKRLGAAIAATFARQRTSRAT